MYYDPSGYIFKLTLITQTNFKKGRGVLLPGAPDFVTLLLIMRHLQVHNIRTYEGNDE